MGQALLGMEAALPRPLEEDFRPFVQGAAAAPLFAGYCVGHVIAELLGHRLEAVDFDFVGVLEHEGIYQAPDLGEGHGFGSLLFTWMPFDKLRVMWGIFDFGDISGHLRTFV